MKMERFSELADKFDTFYAFYKKAPGAEGKPKTYMVATHNLDTKYIQGQLKSAPDHIRKKVKNIKEGYVALFSYTSNCFRIMPVDSIYRLSMLDVELDKQARGSRRFK